MNILNSVELARDRALGFEDEYRRSIKDLEKKEALARQLTQLRIDWFRSETSTSSLEYEVFKRKIELLERKGDVLEAKVILDKYRLEGYYETQQLKQLIAATRPGQKTDAEGQQKRYHEMQEVMKEGSAQLTKALQESVKFRQNILSESKNLQTQLEGVLSEREMRAEKNFKLLDEALTQFIQGVEHSYKTCQRNSRRVTEQYLVLRHNSRIAAQLIARSQNDALLERERLKATIEECRKVANERVAAAEESYKVELETRLQILRSEVMHCEGALESNWQKNDDVRLEWRKTFTKLKSEVRLYKKKYEELQVKRRSEIYVIQSELSALRDDIVNAESALLNPQNKLKKHLKQTVSDMRLTSSRSPGRRRTEQNNADAVGGAAHITRAESLLLENLQKRVTDLKWQLQHENEEYDRLNDHEDPAGRRDDNVIDIP